MDSWIIRPGYVTHFQCTAEACEDSCCYDWTIGIDKSSYRKTCEHPALKHQARDRLKKVKKSENHWAEVKLNDNGGCPFLDADNLCEIHSKAGHQLLSNTCKQYPRVNREQEGHSFESLSLSCPEAARMVLFHPQAFQFDRHASGRINTSNPQPEWISRCHNQAIKLLTNPALSWEQALLAIGILTNKAQSVQDSPLQASQIDTMAAELQELASQGVLQDKYNRFEKSSYHQLKAFVSIHNWLTQNAAGRGRKRFEQILSALQNLASKDPDMTTIFQAWEEIAKPALAEYPDLFHRHILYSLYHMNYPFSDKHTPEQMFKLLLLDAFMVRCYLSVMAADKGSLSQDDIVLCFQVYHTNRQHSANFTTMVMEVFEKAGFTDVATSISLLNTCYQAEQAA